MKYAIVGVGSIGRAVLREIRESDPDAEILAVDSDPRALQEAQRAGDGRDVTAYVVDGGDVKLLSKHAARADVLVNCTVGAQCVEILSAAIDARVPYVDVHGILFEQRMALADAAANAGVTVLLGMGVSPGLTNLLAGYGARRARGEITIDCEYVTYRPLNATAGLLETALRQFRNGARAPVYEDGSITDHPPFSGAMPTRFAGLDDEIELVYTPHSEPVTIPRFIPGLKRVTVRGSYHPKIMTLLKSLHAFGLLDPSLRVEDGGHTLDFQPLLRAALMGDGTLRPAGIPPLYIMRVRVTGVENGVRRVSLVTIGHSPGWDALPQGRLTALPAAYAAQLLARRHLNRPGIGSPEIMEDAHVEGCLALLEVRGLWIRREVSP